MGERPIAIAVAARPFPGETVSGDACQVDWDGWVCRIAVIDGLGHGAQAAAAALAATTDLAAHPTRDPAAAILGCHDMLKGTRGAALLVVRVDVGAGQLTFAGVGNVEAQLWQNGRTQHLVSDRGIVGSVLPRLRPVSLELGGDWRLLMYTDGIRNRFDLGGLRETAAGGHDCAEAVLHAWGRQTDDAIVLVAQPCQGGYGASDSRSSGSI
jgi:serine phosphatase RsbU (regulator of sigma subunit)